MLHEVLGALGSWDLPIPLVVQYAETFTRTDGRAMLYVHAVLGEYHLHIEGLIQAAGPGFYIKFTRHPRNKHGHLDEIIGWDSLYNDAPHVHLHEDRIRQEWELFSWAEIARWLAAYLGQEVNGHEDDHGQ